MIKIVIDYGKINNLKQLIIKKLIIRRAYKGYVWYVRSGDAEIIDDKTPLPFGEFNQFDFWKIEMSFRIYFNKYRGGLFNGNYINFKGVVLNRI